MHPRSRPLLLLAALLVCAPDAAHGQEAASGRDGTDAQDEASVQVEDGEVVALVGGIVRTAVGAEIRGGTVLLRDGRIAAVGKDVVVPAGARSIDCRGKIITPGLIDADSWLGLDPADTSARLPGAETRASDGFDRWDARLRTARQEGVTALVLGGNREQIVGGLASVVATSGAEPISADGPLVLNLSRRSAAGGLQGAARAESVRSTLESARYRRTTLERWQRDVAEYESARLKDGPTAEERLLLPPELLERMRLWTPSQRAAWREATYKSMGRAKRYKKPKKPASPPKSLSSDPGADAIDAVLGTKDAPATRACFVRAALDGDVAATLELANEYGLDVTIAGGAGLRDHAPALKKSGARVVVTELADTRSARGTPSARRPTGLVATLVTSGLKPAIGTGGAGASRFIRLIASREIGAGLTRAAALRAVTIWAAEAAGVGATTGSLEVGKRADVVVWTVSPFSAESRAEHVFVGGREVTDADE